MLTFKEFLNEKIGYPSWVKTTVIAFAAKLNHLEKQIEKETDSHKRDQLLARQAKLIGYISGLGIGIDMEDKRVLSKFRMRR